MLCIDIGPRVFQGCTCNYAYIYVISQPYWACALSHIILQFQTGPFHFFFARKQPELHQRITKRNPTNLEITNQSSCRSKSTTRRETCRWRAAAPSSQTPWMEEDPRADGKSSGLELRRASASLHRRHHLDPIPAASKSSTRSAAARSGRGRAHTATPEGREHAEVRAPPRRSTEHRRRRGRAPPPKRTPTPAAPPTPRRRRRRP